MKFKAILAAMLLFGLIFATCACESGSDPEVINYLNKRTNVPTVPPPHPPPPPPPPQIFIYTTDTDKDILPDELENGETNPDSWRTDGQLDIRRVSTGSRVDDPLFNRVYDRYKRGVQYLMDNNCPTGRWVVDSNGNTFIDSGDDAMNPNGVICEEPYYNNHYYGNGYINIRGVFTGPTTNYLPDEIIITAFEGVNLENEVATMERKAVTIEARLVVASFLEFQRLSGANIPYGGGAEIGGSVYAGGNLTATDYPVTIQGDVYTSGQLINPENAIIAGTLVENFPWELNLDIDNQMFAFREQAAYTGWVINNANGLYCLSNSKDGGSNNLLVLDNFKCLSQPDGIIPASSECDDGIDNDGDTFVDWDGAGATFGDTGCLGQYDLSENPCVGVPPHYDNDADCDYDPATQTGAWILPNSFNGIIYWDNGTNDIHVEGRLGSDFCDMNNCGKSVSVFSDSSHIYIDGWITSGSDADGHPVNVGLVVSGRDKEIRFIENGPIYMRSNVAMMSSRDTWRKETTTSYTASWNNYNLCALYGFCTGMSFDINGNGVIENPNSWGWNELAVEHDNHTNLLVHKGPIITAVGGSAGIWYNPQYFASRTTRSYGYDPAILDYPPPFPKIHDLYRFIEMTVVLDGLQ